MDTASKFSHFLDRTWDKFFDLIMEHDDLSDEEIDDELNRLEINALAAFDKIKEAIRKTKEEKDNQ